MKNNWILFVVCVALFTISCEKEQRCGFTSTQFSFGHFYGKCGGEECIEIFRIENGKLLEDTNDRYPGSDDFYKGQFSTILPQEKYDLVKDLESFFPQELLNESETVIGQPDAGDWGGIYIEVTNGTLHRFWLLDQMDSNMPAEYNSFVDRINEKIALINQ